MKLLRRLFRRRRDPHSLDPVRPMVRPEERDARELRRRMGERDYVPQNEFHRDRRQERANDNVVRLTVRRRAR